MSSTVPQLEPEVLRSRIARFRQVEGEMVTQVRRVIVGQQEVLEQVMIALFVGGHCLITRPPPPGHKTPPRRPHTPHTHPPPPVAPGTTPGPNIIDEDPANGRRTWTFVPGPIFANILLADEINRTPPKTQSALLEAMQERACTVRGNNYLLPAPFFVLATQNPIELEGTYPLPEAQLDRFLFNTVLDYLDADEELKVVDLTTVTSIPQADTVTDAQEILDFQQLVRMVPIGESVARHAVELVRVSRSSDENAPDFVKKYVNYGASVRAAQFLVLAAKAKALMKGRYHVTYEDIRSLYIPVLRHRILLNFHAESDRLKQDDILKRILEWKAAPSQ